MYVRCKLKYFDQEKHCSSPVDINNNFIRAGKWKVSALLSYFMRPLQDLRLYPLLLILLLLVLFLPLLKQRENPDGKGCRLLGPLVHAGARGARWKGRNQVEEVQRLKGEVNGYEGRGAPFLLPSCSWPRFRGGGQVGVLVAGFCYGGNDVTILTIKLLDLLEVVLELLFMCSKFHCWDIPFGCKKVGPETPPAEN